MSDPVSDAASDPVSDPVPDPVSEGAPVFEIREVEAGYGRAALVLRGLSVRVGAGQVVCLVGPNGAGKSTVLKVASGLLTPRSGQVLLRGDDVKIGRAHV